MKAMVTWAVRNSPSMNTLMLAVIAVGAFAMASLQRERFPEYRPDEVRINVVYPGASPVEIEQSICLKIEEAIQPIIGLRKVTSVAEEGAARISAELETDVTNPQRVVNEIQSAVDRIPSFPEEIEQPEVRLAVRLRNVISVGVIGPEAASDSAERELREVAESVRDEILQLPDVSHANLWHAKPYQIDVELSENALRKYSLTHADVADAIRRGNVEVPSGDIKTDQSDYLVRISNKQRTGEGIARIPVVTHAGGLVLTVGDLGTVRDGFQDVDVFAQLNGRPAMSMEIRRSPDQDMVEIQRQVREYVASKELPIGFELRIWNDYSKQMRDRIDLMSRNAITGLLLVFIVLALFLDLRLAFWVAMGIPVSVLGACAVMAVCGATINMHSMFAFVMALGIIVDDAIVISENVFRHRQQGRGRVEAAIVGTSEVAPSVICSAMTTVAAFMPLAYISGEMGKWIAVIPLALVSMLLISLFEGLFILPCHLAHLPDFDRPGLIERFQRNVQKALDRFIDIVYLPALRWSLRYPESIVASSIAALCVVAGFYFGGYTPLVMNQQLNWEFVYAYVEYPKGTPTRVIDEATQRMESALREIQADAEASGGKLVNLVYRGVGYTSQLDNKRGEVYAELDPGMAYDETTSRRIVDRWRTLSGGFPDAERAVFWGLNNSPGGKAIELSLLSGDIDELEAVAEALKARLRSYDGVSDISDSRGPGKWELQLKLKPEAEVLGVRLDDLGRTVRAAYYGEEVMRLQRGRHEVKVMVRYSPDERSRLASMREIRVRTPDDREVPLPALAEVNVQRGYSRILRIDQQRAVTITADVDESIANAGRIAADLEEVYLAELLRQHPTVRTRWDGRQRERRQSVSSLFLGFLVAVFAMFLLLTLEFRCYIQPLIILSLLPFGMIGAVLGHFLMQQPLTLFSLFGMVTLSGVVANDSIVLIDFVNRRRAEGTPLREALLNAGKTRFRPVILTTVTTVAALLPLLLERNTQAQVLIPMAVSIAFGLMLATVWVLLLAPVLYQAYAWTRGDTDQGVDR